MKQENEIWKKIPQFENYEVSNFGRVRRVLKTGYYYRSPVIQHGYNHVTFSYCKGTKFKSFQVHRLVALLFIDNPQNKKCVNHIDGNKQNNNVKNLEWCTHSENEIHSYHVLNKKSPATKLKLEDVLYIRENTIFGKKGNTVSMAKKFNVSLAQIHNIVKLKSWV